MTDHLFDPEKRETRRTIGVYFVQRVTRLPRANELKKGVDRHFRMDYMGATEFEGGRLRNALDEMRKRLDKLQVLPIENLPVGLKKKRLWFLGDPQYLDRARILIADQVGEMRALLCEPTRMRYTLLAKYDNEKPLGSRYDAWWALDTKDTLTIPYHAEGNSPWLVFVQKDDAKLWLRDLNF